MTRHGVTRVGPSMRVIFRQILRPGPARTRGSDSCERKGRLSQHRSNNRLKLPARGRPTRTWRWYSRAAA